jgi:hypothetical protein
MEEKLSIFSNVFANHVYPPNRSYLFEKILLTSIIVNSLIRKFIYQKSGSQEFFVSKFWKFVGKSFYKIYIKNVIVKFQENY